MADSSYVVNITSGKTLLGFRLEPGSTIDEKGIQKFAKATDSDELQRGHWISEFCHVKTPVKEALEGLRSELPNINAIAKHLGVSVRTLQRLVKQETGKSPHFWNSLVRARRCARLLCQQVPLVEAAYSSGYADHAHMTREMRRWFNTTPSSIRTELSMTEIHSSGYD
ncbi:MAG: helix-turn-helix domain-containing protein [Pseudomonadales bacterium]|nr:helix-turn-helix domain-containing protein [Pseudomonadales bacterium]